MDMLLDFIRNIRKCICKEYRRNYNSQSQIKSGYGFKGTGSGMRSAGHPTADGSFIQLDMAKTWDEVKWLSEFRYLKEVGMHYLVAMSAAYTYKSGTITYYPTSLEGCKMDSDTDIINHMLSAAEKTGFKVFIGINMNEAWWIKEGRDPDWLYEQMRKDNLIADELYRLYHAKYPKAFYGWYWVYEADNFSFRNKKQFKVLSNAINIQLDFFVEKKERLPFMISPFMNSVLSCPDTYANGWEYFFQNTHLKSGDIFCPQDSAGAGGLKLDEVTAWFAAFRRAVDKRPGLLFWANTEDFISKSHTSAPVKRFVKQMEIESPFVDNIITFAYCHYYSPNNIDPGYHLTYSSYVRSGKLDNKPPSVPVGLTVRKLARNRYQVSWLPAADDFGICGYVVYRNGKQIFKTEAQRKYGGGEPGPVLEYTDSIKCLLEKNEPEYDVKAFDFAGNYSMDGHKKNIIRSLD